MKREIKFRGKRIDNKKWVYGFLADEDYINDIDSIDLSSIEVDIDTVCEFTGLLDKNGKEIYEGDIISVNGKYPKLVKYIDDYACFCLANITDLNKKWISPWQQVSPSWWNDFKREIRVIGNMYDHPELIKEE
jgi:uncharacterized phage protein (TIGR01671 family)